MRYLLDTHVLLWVLTAPNRLSREVAETLANKDNALMVSAASGMEVATKVRLGRLEGARGLVAAWSARVVEIGARELPITSEHAILAGSMSWEHRDPFDRLIVAQALTENMVIVTVDRQIRTFPGVRMLTW